MIDEPLVSICLCTYNGEKFLAEQLSSILQQDYSNFELIIIDDCSTDNTYEQLLSYTDPRIRLYRNEKNLGYAGNFGKALSLSKGDLIALADQDDIWLSEKIKLMVEKIGGYSGVYHDSALMSANGVLTGRSISNKVRFIEGLKPKTLLLKNYISGHALMVGSEVLKVALPIPKGIYHDWWLSFVCMNLKGMTFIEEPLVNYRIHESNQTVLARMSKKVSIKDPSALRRYNKIRKLAETILMLKTFRRPDFVSKELKDLLSNFISLEEKRLKSCFSVSLFLFLLRHMSIYKSKRDGLLGKLNTARNDSKGINI